MGPSQLTSPLSLMYCLPVTKMELDSCNEGPVEHPAAGCSGCALSVRRAAAARTSTLQSWARCLFGDMIFSLFYGVDKLAAFDCLRFLLQALARARDMRVRVRIISPAHTERAQRWLAL